MPDSLGDSAQTRLIAEQVAEAVIVKYDAAHPRPKEPEIPGPLKWAAGIIAAVFAAGITAGVFWIVTSISEMQVTLARMDERMASGSIKDGRVDELERRVTAIELKLNGTRHD